MNLSNKLALLSLTLLGMASLPAVGAARKFALDPSHTQVRVTWNHAGFSNPGASFDVSDGLLAWDAVDPRKSSVTVSIPAASASTQVPALDETFRTEYFAAAKYPTITFASTAVEPMGTDRYRISGNLTIRGITKPVTLEAVLNKVGEHPMFHAPAIGFDAVGTVKRSEFGMGAYVPMVSDDVQIRITAEAVDPDALKKAMEGEAK